MIDREIIESLYEAAIVPELWPGVLDRLGKLAGCDKAVLYAANESREVAGWIANEKAHPLMERFVAEGWAARNELAMRAIARKEPDFSVDLDLFTEQEIGRSPLYQEFLIPNGLAWGIGTVIQSPSDDMMMITIHRALEHGPVPRQTAEEMTALRPHLSRAAFITTRLRLEQAKIAVNALEALGLPAVALRHDRRISIMNRLFEIKVPEIAYDRHGRLAFANPETNQVFTDALALRRGGKTFPVLGLNDTRFVGHLVPIEGAARDLFSAMDAILVLVEVGIRDNIDPCIIQSLFDLTPAEAAIGTGLILGKTVDQIALERKTSIETVRSQLKATMAKTGTSRQVELVKLLSMAQWPPGPNLEPK